MIEADDPQCVARATMFQQRHGARMATRLPRGTSASPLRIAVGVVAVLVIAVLAVRAVLALFGPRPDAFRLSYYVCDECGELFVAPRGVPPVECPKCHKKAGAIVVWLRCSACGHCYPGLRYGSVPGREGEFYGAPPADLPVQQIKWDGDSWLNPGSAEGIELLHRIHVCPKCGAEKVGALGPPSDSSHGKPPEAEPQ